MAENETPKSKPNKFEIILASSYTTIEQMKAKMLEAIGEGCGLEADQDWEVSYFNKAPLSHSTVEWVALHYNSCIAEETSMHTGRLHSLCLQHWDQKEKRLVDYDTWPDKLPPWMAQDRPNSFPHSLSICLSVCIQPCLKRVYAVYTS